MSPKLVKPRGVWNSLEAGVFLEQTTAVAESDVRKLLHDPNPLSTA
jgi:hypothetical protein